MRRNMFMNYLINKKFSGLLFFLLFLIPCQAIIIETDSLISLVRHIADDRFLNEEILVIFDIDNTIGESCWELGGYRWYQYMLAKKMNEGLSEREAEKAIYTIINQITQFTSMRTLEAFTPALIKELQAAGFMTLAATGRTELLFETTFKQLAEIHIDFSQLWPQESFNFNLDTKFPVLYKNGILFCGPNKKGIAVAHFLKMHGLKPKKIIFIDDLLKYVHEFEHTMAHEGIECVILHYTLIEKISLPFDPVESEKKLAEMLEKIDHNKIYWID